MTGYISIVRNADIFIKSCKSNISERQKSAFLKYRHMEGRQIQKMNKVLARVELTKAEEKTLIWLAGWEESTVDHLLSVIEKAARIRADKKGGYAHI